MTIERAKKILKRRTTIPGDDATWEEINEAIDFSINILDSWEQLEETITEIKENNKFENNDVTKICQFLINYMYILKEMKDDEKNN